MSLQLGGVCTSVPSSSGVIHDSSSPFTDAARIVATAGAAVDAAVPEPEAYYQTVKTAIHASWLPFHDPHTSISTLEVGLGTSGTSTNVIDFQSVAVGTTAITFTPPAPDTEFQEGLGYRVVFRTTNVAGAMAVTSTAPVIIDTTPPVVDWVVDVFPVEVAGVETHYTDDNPLGDVDLTDASVVRSKFRCTDPQSEAQGLIDITYEWQVCDAADCSGAVYQPWLSTADVPRATAPGSILASAQAAGTLTTVYTQTRCTNGAGLTSVASSDGMVYDLTPADTSNAVVLDLNPAASAGAGLVDVDWLNNDELDVAWSGFVTEVGRPAIVGYSFAIGTSPGLADIAPFTPNGVATSASTNAVAGVADGTVVYVTVEAVTAAGATSTVSSDGVGLDRITPQPVVGDITSPFPPTDPRRCASHLQCIDLPGASPGSTTDISYVASTQAVTAAMLSRTGTAPLATLGYGASSCDAASVLALDVVPLHISPDPSATTAVMDGLFLSHRQEVCLLMFTTSETGLGSYGVSNGIIVDLTAPVAHVVNEGSSDTVDDDVVGALDAVTATVQCSDVDSGIDHAQVALHRVSFSSGAVLEEVVPWTPVAASQRPPAVSSPAATTTLTGLSLTEGEFYVTSVRCVNQAGATSTLASDGFFVDTSPPGTASAALFHTVHHLAITAQADTGVLHASWSGFVDPQSDIVAFDWSIGTTPGGSDVLPQTPLGSATAASINLPLQDGETYFITVYATNGAGLVSSITSGGVTVDGSPPPPVTNVELATDTDSDGIAWVMPTTTLAATWDLVVDPHSDATYRWSVGTVPQGQQVVPWTDVGTATSASVGGVTLIPGVRYYANVESTNEAGLRSHVASAPMAVDSLPPRAGRVVDGTLSAPHRFQASTDTLSCAWDGFVDTMSGIGSYHVGFGTAAGAMDVSPATVLSPAADSHIVTGLSLAQGTEYFCTVVAYDLVGQSVSASSRGVVVDTTPPQVGDVLDLAPTSMQEGLGHVDIDTVAAPTSVHATWADWSDPESGLVLVEWAVGTTPGANDITAWSVAPPGALSVSYDLRAAGVTVSPGTILYASARMTNGLGLTAQATSDGVTVLATGSVAGSPDLVVNANVLLVPATPMLDATDNTWCACSGGAVFDPVSGSCSCPPGTYLDADTLQCIACPASTCKPAIGNAASLCDASLCAATAAVVPVPPPAASSLATCGAAGSGRVVRPSDGSCVCPAGTYTSGSGAPCIPCGEGTVNPLLADVGACSVCGRPTTPDAVLHVTWNDYAAALGQPLSAIVVSVGTSPGAMRWEVTVDPSASFAQVVPPFHSGSTLWVRVRMEVAAVRRRLSSATDSIVVADEGTSIDVHWAPPVRGSVIDGTSLADADVQASRTQLAASWFGFQTDGEGAVGVEVAFGSQGPFSTDLVGFEPASSPTNHAAVAPQELPDGTVVHATVRATSLGTGAWTWASSDGIRVESSLPNGVVMVEDALAVLHQEGPTGAPHAAKLASSVGVAATWQLDAAALVYEWSVVDLDDVDASGTPATLLPFTSVGSATWAVAHVSVPDSEALATALDTPLPGGHSIAVRVRATNAAGVQRVMESSATLVPLPAAVAPTVQLAPGAGDPPTAPTTSTTYQVDTSTLAVQWQCAASSTPITHVSVSVGSVVDGSQVLDRGVLTTPSPLVLTGLSLQHGHCYTAQVRCFSDAASSELGVSQPMCIDTTGPAVGAELFHPISRAVSTSSATATELLVQASLADSAGLYVPHAAGLAALAADQASELAPATLHVSPTLEQPAEMRVTAVDTSSHVTALELAWATAVADDSEALEQAAVVPRTAVALTRVDAAGVGSASAGVTYATLAAAAGSTGPVFAHWLAQNGAGTWSQTPDAHTQVVFDGTAPTAPAPLDVNSVQASTESITVQWAYSDDESPMLGYAWSVQRSDGTDVVPPTVTLASGATAAGLALVHGESYTVTVTACNVALVCRSDTATVLVDSSPPTTGTIYLGLPDAELEGQLCPADGASPCSLSDPLVAGAHAITSLGPVSWGRITDGESGIDHIDVTVGTSPGGSQLGGLHGLDATTSSALFADLITMQPLDLERTVVDATTVYVTVTATNTVGVTAETTVLVAVIDSEPPPLLRSLLLQGSPAQVGVESSEATLVNGGSIAPVVTQPNTDAATVDWQWHPTSVLVDVRVQEVSLVGGTSGTVAGPTQVPLSESNWTWTGLSLEPATRYHSVLTCIDGAGNRITVRSHNWLVVDNTPPVQLGGATASLLGVGVVSDGLRTGDDSDCQSQTGNTNFALDTLVTVYAPLNVTDDELAGLNTTDVSTLPSAEFNSTREASTSLLFHADPFVDLESGIALVEVFVGTAPLEDDVMAAMPMPTKSLHAVRVVLPQQPVGTHAFVSIRVTNGAGLSALAVSDGVRLLCDPGTSNCDYDGTFVCI